MVAEASTGGDDATMVMAMALGLAGGDGDVPAGDQCGLQHGEAPQDGTPYVVFSQLLK